MHKLKHWLYNRFLPVWCRAELMQENERLRKRLLETQRENDRLRAYIDGLHTALKCQRRGITIHNGEAKL